MRNYIKHEIENIEYIPNTSISRIAGIKKMSIWHKGNEQSLYLIKVLTEELKDKGLKILGYVNGSKDKYSPIITLITVREDYERPSKSIYIDKGDMITYIQFKNRSSIGIGSKQYQIIKDIYEVVKGVK